jgi:hypothetical protein
MLIKISTWSRISLAEIYDFLDNDFIYDFLYVKYMKYMTFWSRDQIYLDLTEKFIFS